MSIGFRPTDFFFDGRESIDPLFQSYLPILGWLIPLYVNFISAAAHGAYAMPCLHP
ncbi:MAG: hypothetical protein AB1656_00690 [Candidatus Omnitrophota bacterium]